MQTNDLMLSITLAEAIDNKITLGYLKLLASNGPSAYEHVPLADVTHRALVELMMIWETLTGAPHPLDEAVSSLEDKSYDPARYRPSSRPHALRAV